MTEQSESSETPFTSVAMRMLAEQDDRPSRPIQDSDALTASEQEGLDEQIVDDQKALDLATEEVRTSTTARELLPGEVRKSCPGCTFERIGTQDSLAIKEYRSHMRRHAHARFGDVNETNFHGA